MPALPPRRTAPPPASSAAAGAGIGEDAAIGDRFTATTADGVQVTGRITDMRRVGKRWTVELTCRNGLAAESRCREGRHSPHLEPVITRHGAHYFRFNTSLSEPWR